MPEFTPMVIATKKTMTEEFQDIFQKYSNLYGYVVKHLQEPASPGTVNQWLKSVGKVWVEGVTHADVHHEKYHDANYVVSSLLDVQERRLALLLAEVRAVCTKATGHTRHTLVTALAEYDTAEKELERATEEVFHVEAGINP